MKNFCGQKTLKSLSLLIVLIICCSLMEAKQLDFNAKIKPNIPPLKKQVMLKWVKSMTYLENYVGEPAIHLSLGPHGRVKTYFNSVLAEDLKNGRTKFRKGASMVKELYSDASDRIIGYSVMTKTNKNAGGKGQGWLFFESLDIAANKVDFFGQGNITCTGCHKAGTDYLLSSFRP